MKRPPVPAVATLHEILITRASTDSGFAPGEVFHDTAAEVSRVTLELVRAGLLHRGRIGRTATRYFAHASAASLYEAPSLMASPLRRAPKPVDVVDTSAEPASKPPRLPARQYNRAPWPKDAPMVITAETKVTLAPAPPTGIYKTNTFSR